MERRERGERGEKTSEEGEWWKVVSYRRSEGRRGRGWHPNTGWRLGTTFFFRNFPEGCTWEALKRRFEEVGRVEDLFLPAKRDKKGGRFGFVRISNGGEVEEILGRLNRIWIGSYVLRAFLPKHERPRRDLGERGEKSRENGPSKVSGGTVQPRRGPAEKTANERVLVPWEGGEKFSDVVAGSERQKGYARIKEPPDASSQILYQSKEGEGDWLVGAFTGCFKNDFSWSEFGEELKNECVGSLDITDMGGKLVLIRSASDRSTEETLGGFEDWTKFWFEW